MRFRLPAALAPILLITLLTLLLTACHTAKALLPAKLLPAPDTSHSLETAKQQLKDATPCCGSFADFSYDTILPWQPKKFQLGSGSLVADLNGVRSYFLAFRLPVGVKLPYRVALKSELNGRWLQSSYLFAPSTVLLDEAFQPIDSQDINLCEYMGWSDEASGAFGSVTISSDKARYLVVYASDKQQTSATYWEQSPAAFSAEAPVKMNSNGSFKIPHGPDGTIWIGIMDKTYAKAVDNAICSKPPQGNGVLNTLRTALPTHLNWSHS
ncbi:MAG: MalM family protein [Rhodanobacter sp.]